MYITNVIYDLTHDQMILSPQCGVYTEYTHGKSFDLWANWEINKVTHPWNNYDIVPHMLMLSCKSDRHNANSISLRSYQEVVKLLIIWTLNETTHNMNIKLKKNRTNCKDIDFYPQRFPFWKLLEILLLVPLECALFLRRDVQGEHILHYISSDHIVYNCPVV